MVQIDLAQTTDGDISQVAPLLGRAHREKFLRKVEQIKELKFRVSYGQTGNERIPPFSYAARLNNAFYADNDGLDFGLAPGSLENQDLKWETTTQFNIGVDVSLFDDKVNSLSTITIS